MQNAYPPASPDILDPPPPPPGAFNAMSILVTCPDDSGTAGNVKVVAVVMFSLWNSVPSPGGVNTSTLPPIVVLLSIGYNLGGGVVVTS